MTTSDGYAFGVTNEGTMVPYNGSAKIGHVNAYTYAWFDNATDAKAGTNPLASNHAKVTNIVGGQTVTVKASGGARMRIATQDPTSDWSKFGNLNESDVEVGSLTVGNGGTITGNVEFWYSLAGDDANSNREAVMAANYAGNTIETNATVTDAMRTISMSLTVSAYNA